MPQYRYTFMSMRDDAPIAELDLTGVSAIKLLNQPGQFTATVRLDSTGIDNRDVINATVPGKTYCVIERDNVPVYAAVIWSRTYQSENKTLDLNGWGFEAVPQRQLVLSSTNITGGSVNLFLQLWTQMFSEDAARNFNMVIPSSSAGPSSTVTVLPTDYHFYSEIMDALANASDGFDWTIDVTRVGNVYTKTLRVGYPTIGKPISSPDAWVFEYPGSILNYIETDSMASAGTNIYALGAGEGSGMIVATSTQPNMLGPQRWPRWDLVTSHKDVTDPNILNNIVAQEAVNFKPPAPTWKIEVAARADPIFGSYGLGDACALVITDGRYPSPGNSQPGLQVNSRIVGWELHPSDDTQFESLTLYLPGDTVNG